MFEIGAYVVCPGHGVGQVMNIETKELGGQEATFYIVKILANGMTIMVPSTKKNGIRELISTDEVKKVYDLLEDHDVKLDTSTWNRRHRDYMNKLKTGSLLEIADVLRSLLLLKNSKKLSFGERKMLDQCQELIVSEISITTGDAEDKINSKISQIFPEVDQDNA